MHYLLHITYQPRTSNSTSGSKTIPPASLQRQPTKALYLRLGTQPKTTFLPILHRMCGQKANGWGRNFEADVDIKVMEVSPISEKGGFREGNSSRRVNAPDNPVWDVRNQKGLKWQPCTHHSTCPIVNVRIH